MVKSCYLVIKRNFEPKRSKRITTSDAYTEGKPDNNEPGSSHDAQKTPRNIRSFYSSSPNAYDAHPSNAASKAAAMWPNAASVQARKRAEEEAGRLKASQSPRPDENVEEHSQAETTSEQQEPNPSAAASNAEGPTPTKAEEAHRPDAEAQDKPEEKTTSASEAESTSKTDTVQPVEAPVKEPTSEATAEQASETPSKPSSEKATEPVAQPASKPEAKRSAQSPSAQGSSTANHSTPSPSSHNPRTLDAQASAHKKAPQDESSQPGHAQHARPPKAAKTSYKKVLAIGAVTVAAVVALIVVLVNVIPITVTINGEQVQIAGAKTLSAAIDKAEVKPTAGNLLAVDGSIITEGGGQPFDATIDEETTSDPNYALSDGDVITVGNGSDIVEDFVTTTEPAPFSATVDGQGALHLLSGAGQNGEYEVETGSVSGLQAVTTIEDPVNVICTYRNSNVGDQKVIALTFDDGPNANFTPQILDILERNGASATFFTLGSRITGDCVEIVQRAYNAGNQICTHSWDHAAGSGNGVDLSHMTKEEQVDEILKGYEAIEAALGVEASHTIRTPGGNFPPEVIANLSPYITSEIGWNIDTQDWRKPGVAAIKAQLLSVSPGDIVLMHDGGGDRSQTVQALSEALPVLKQRGFQFVTIDQLLEITAANG